MEKSVLKMLGTLMCALSACAVVVPVQDFDLQKIAGKWYIAGMASNADWFVTHKADMKMGTAVLVATAEGDLDFSYASLKSDGTCWRQHNLANKTETPGRFTFTSPVWNNENDMRFVDVQSDDYAVVYTIKTKAGVSDVLTELYRKSPEVSEELQQKFKQFSQDNGVLSENIVILPKNDECPEA
ncbi:lipocalin-like [Cynoglossus semilaevis]|uniref:lipocalin-like n=1 Tax=Cynoglossus semilaevis TaxID=244447 RepID=UPI00049799FB|nr:lipocalin-like [Cynoglossus semilaevis]